MRGFNHNGVNSSRVQNSELFRTYILFRQSLFGLYRAARLVTRINLRDIARLVRTPGITVRDWDSRTTGDVILVTGDIISVTVI